jgi:hypothetical protein
MKTINQIMFAILMVAAVFSGSTRKLLGVAANAIESDAAAADVGGKDKDTKSSGGAGGTCE